MGYDTATMSHTTTSYQKTFFPSLKFPTSSSDSFFDTIISYLLLPPLFITYIISYQFLLIISIIDQLADTPFIKKTFEIISRTIAITLTIFLTIFNWVTKPLKWIGDVFYVWETIYWVYEKLRNQVLKLWGYKDATKVVL